MNYPTKRIQFAAHVSIGLSILCPHQCTAAAKQSDEPLLSAVLDGTDATKHLDEGVFTDSAKQKHPWKISAHHALTWEGRDYIPVGGRFTPSCWTHPEVADNFDSDCKRLDAIAASGVRDLYFSTGGTNLLSVPAKSVQQILDYADKSGIHYGLQINAFEHGTLQGVVIKPATNKAVSPAKTAVFDHIGDTKKAYYLIVSSQDTEVLKSGTVDVSDGVAVVNDDFTDDNIVLLYPETKFGGATPESQLPDIWAGFDSYRDAILVYLQGLKYGPGFRYFVDPIATDIDLAGDADIVIPTSAGFHLDFEQWLRKKYDNNINDLVTGWGNTDQDIPDFKTAARLFPMWSHGKGMPFLTDPTNQTHYAIENHPGIKNGFWDDFRRFRFHSLAAYNASISSILKSSVAQVPILLRTRGNNASLPIESSSPGIDGLMVIQNSSTSITQSSITESFARAEQTTEPLWLMSDADFANQNPGVQSRSFVSSWESAKSAGIRGFYGNELNTGGNDLSPDLLTSYADYAKMTARTSGSLNSDIGILWYPREAGAEGVTSRRLSSGVMWLPSYKSGGVYALGPSLKAYSIPSENGDFPTYVLWSPGSDAGEVTFNFGKDHPLFTDSAGVPIKTKKKKDEWTFTVTGEPIQISGIRELSLPTNIIALTESRIQELMAEAERQNIATGGFTSQLFYTKNNFDDKPADVPVKFHLLENIEHGLEAAISPYVWVEGESAKPTNFTSVSNNSQASNGGVLTLDTDADPGSAANGYFAEYNFTVNSRGKYDLWIAGTKLDGKINSPIGYQVNQSVPSEITGAESANDYGDQFSWTRLGEVNLVSGQNKIVMRIVRRAKSDNRFRMTIDALCLTREAFRPSGTQRPAIIPVSRNSGPNKKH